MERISPSGVSCAQVDDSFGPHAGSCRGGFDFTLLFEETILTLLPLALLVLALPFRGQFLLRKAKKIAKTNHLVTLKLVSSLLFFLGNLDSLLPLCPRQLQPEKMRGVS